MEIEAPAAKRGDPNDVLDRAEEHFNTAIEMFQDMTRRMRAGEHVGKAEADGSARAVHSATQTLFTLKLRLEDERKKSKGIVNDYAVDLDAAREDIARRLARLRAAGGAGEVS